jgi:uncharacterized membrane protein HdeD (DUF308 family)
MMVDSGNFAPGIRSAVRRHRVLLLIAGVIMVVLGLLGAASPLVSKLVVDTAAGWMLLTAGFIGLAALTPRGMCQALYGLSSARYWRS